MGCFNNVQLFSDLLRHMKGAAGGVAIQLDITKAFDSVPHCAIQAALARKGVPDHLANFIAKSYEGVKTTIAHPDGAIDIVLKRGVKQGDPLSPLLFNLLIEPLLIRLESMKGYNLGGQSISSLAFADDLLLIGEDKNKATALLEETVRYLGKLGLGIAPDKCFAFQVVTTRDSWLLRDPQIRVGMDPITFCDASMNLTYLGVKVSPWLGVNISEVGSHLEQVLRRVGELRLKPFQKLTLINKFLIPHFVHQLVISIPSRALLRKLDTSIRAWVKEYLHLPASTSNGILYATNRDGGLGVPVLEDLVGRVALRAGVKYLLSEDPAIRAMATHSVLQGKLEKLADSLGVKWPCSLTDLKRVRKQQKSNILRAWAAQKVQGATVDIFKGDSVGNSFLRQPSLLKPTRFKTALQFRTDTAATRASLRRAKIVKPGEDTCRKCGETQETLGHVLNKCRSMHERIIKRHDDIVKILSSESLRQDQLTTEEAMLGLTGENLKPDLIVLSQEAVFVVDVTVCYEHKGFVGMARQNKIARYTELQRQLKSRFNVTHGEVIPVVIGSRGAMPAETIKGLKKIRLASKGLLKTLSLSALRGSLELYHSFMDR
ncbi:Hypothetical predicted protein [Cloeon dipterum]|uniref:Reverse transcriptase domain-containing protein n=1 Tax=Cloeon dipterum TaxID=197152 RepID=A0A8S1E4F0_9INSE|nr:Hypothetical predicted protein [Cloeon dipterum]